MCNHTPEHRPEGEVKGHTWEWEVSGSECEGQNTPAPKCGEARGEVRGMSEQKLTGRCQSSSFYPHPWGQRLGEDKFKSSKHEVQGKCLQSDTKSSPGPAGHRSSYIALTLDLIRILFNKCQPKPPSMLFCGINSGFRAKS